MDRDEAVELSAEWIDDGARDEVVVSGPDAQSYLQSQLAQEVRDLEVGAARWTFVLDPSGKVDALARISRTDDERFVLDTDAGYGDGLAARVNRFKIRVDADVVVRAGAVSEPSVEAEDRRIAAGWPRMGREIEPGSTIPATTGVVPLAIDFTKGCYPGQELVERMDSRGADAPRSLRIVEVDPGVVAGDPLVVCGDDVGVVTSVAADGRRALAYVKRGHDIGHAPAH